MAAQGKIWIGMFLVLCLTVIPPGSIRAQKTDYDSGPIEVISENLVFVKGNRGTHVLEPIGECIWCEVGLEVLITFDTFVRVSFKPYSDAGNSRARSAFLVKDGREDGE
ncbi:MAG TPA: hypothetical protein VK463_09170 [Desulfomonilaceae bacterium]|nr:hypothetical protein [Desulfomonilaceae bacterium]